MHIGTKVGEFSFSRKHKLSPSLEVETTYQGDIIQEHKLAKEEVESNFRKFAEKYGIKTAPAEAPKKGGEHAEGLLN